MAMKELFTRWFKLRFAALYPFGIYVILFSYATDQSCIAGIWFIVAGLLIRIWANCYAIKSEKLTTSGPYAFVRHPLYLGSLLLILGFIVLLRIYYIGTILLLTVIIIYFRKIKEEERLLTVKFPDAYQRYTRKVPTIFFTFIPYREGEKWSASLERLIRSQEYKLFFWVIILTIAFYLKGKFLIEHQAINTRYALFISLAAFLAGLDIIGEIVKFFHKKLPPKLTG